MEDLQEISKLIILYFFDQMEVPLKEDIVNEIFNEHSNWLPYTEYRSCFEELKRQNLLINLTPKASVPRYGLTVIIEHRDGYKTVYSNLLTTEFVTEGEEVSKGQTIGTVGNSAAFEIADEPHLHFEMIKNEEPVNPIFYLK